MQRASPPSLNDKNMERKDFTTVGDVLRECLAQSQLQGRLDEVKACDMWGAVLGPGIAGQCRRPTVFKGTMTVSVANAALRQELHMRRGAIADAINEALGKETIKEIRLVT